MKAKDLKTGMSFKYAKNQRKNRLVIKDAISIAPNEVLICVYKKDACHQQIVLPTFHEVIVS